MNNHSHRHLAVLYVLLFLGANAWARALPTPLDTQTGLLSIRGSDIPTPIPPATSPNGISWIRCGLTASVDEVMDLGCAMLGHEPPLHKGSAKMLGVDSHIHEVRVDEKHDISHPASILHPCMFEHASGLRRLRCKGVDRVSRKVLDDSTFESLVADLLNGIPISIGPQISVKPGFETSSYLVSIFLSDNSYDLRLITAQNPTSSIESFPSNSVPARFEPDPLINLSQPSTEKMYVQRNSTGKRPELHLGFELKKSLYCWLQENKYDTEIGLNCGVIAEAILDFDNMTVTENDLNAFQDRIGKYLTDIVMAPLVDLFQTALSEDTWHRIPMLMAQALIFQLSRLLDNSVVDSADFDWTPIVQRLQDTIAERDERPSEVDTISANTTERMDNLGRTLLQYLNKQSEIGRWSDHKITDSNNGEISGLFRRSAEQGHVRRQLVRAGNPRVKTSDTFPTPKGDAISSPGTMVNHWFRCWEGPGTKVLCEIPDDHQAIEGAKNVKRVTSLGSLDVGRPSSVTQPQILVHLLADQPRFWNNCKFDTMDGKHGMVCPDTPHPEYADISQIYNRIVNESSPLQLNRLALKRDISSSPIPSTLSAAQTQLEQQPLTTTSPNTTTPCKRPVFGRMGGTFAYTGFFTVLAIVTIILFLVVRKLFLILQDAFDAYADRRKKNKRLASRKDLSFHGQMDLPALDYVSNVHSFTRSNDGVTASVNVALTAVGELPTTSTGSQLVGEGGDTIKRKKAAMRVVIDEEQGVTTVDVERGHQ